MDWLNALDFELALKNVHSDVYGDWYRDPWGWRELAWLVPNHLDTHAVPRLNASGVKRTARLDVAKENFAIRPAVVLDPLDRLLYQGLVDCLSVRFIGSMPKWVYGWRLPCKSPKRGQYDTNDNQWEAFRDHLKRLAGYDFAALTTDVVSFFASIPVDELTELILTVGNNRPAERLADMVRSWYRTTGRGLPQRSGASAALAHSFLAPLDDVIARFNRIPKGGAALIPEGRSLRWMDDIWLFGRSLYPLREAQIALQSGMRDLGLEMNIGKTRLLVGDDLINAVYELEHSAVDDGLSGEERDEQPLDDLIDGVLASPETAERTTIRFMATRMREHQVYTRVEDVARAVPRLPHAPDHLARLFRDSGYWHNLQDSYVSYARRWRNRLPWTVGQLGTMFPSGSSVKPALRDLFAETLSSGNVPLPLLSLAAQRLAAWRPAEARLLLRDAAQTESHPLARRTLALAAIHAGEAKNVVRQMLQQHEENALILAMLEDVGFTKQAVPVSADFAG
jgi:hypothetical protein